MTSSHRDRWLNAYSTFSLLWKDDSHNETGIKIKAEKLFSSNWLAFWQQGAFMSPQSYSTCIVPQTWKITDPIHLLNAFLLNCSTYKHAQTINMNCTQNVLIPPTECNTKRKLFFVFSIASGLCCQTLQMSYTASGCILRHQHYRSRW